MSRVSKEAQARSSRKHYAANRVEMIARAKKYTREVAEVRNTRYIREYKENHPCVDCKETDWVVLQFHHLSGNKDANIADSRVKAWSLERLKREIEKCIILCANCHLRRHYKERLCKKVLAV